MQRRATSGVISVLAVLSSSEDQRYVRSVLNHPDWQCYISESMQDAMETLREHPIGIVIAGKEFSGKKRWTDLVAEMQKLEVSPPVIATDRLAEERFWAEVLNLRAYDLLEEFTDPDEPVRVLRLAWLFWKHTSGSSRWARLSEPFDSAPEAKPSRSSCPLSILSWAPERHQK